MAFQTSVAVGNAQLDALETAIGASAVVKIFTGAEPVNCAAADPAGLLVTIQCPVDWMSPAAARSKALLGTWSGTATAAGNAASFRLYASDGTTCGAQGSVTASGGSGDMTTTVNSGSGPVPSVAFTVGAVVTVDAFTLGGSNA